MVCKGYRAYLGFHFPVIQPFLKHFGLLSVCVSVLCDFVSFQIVFLMTGREILTSQPIPIKTLRLWLIAPFNCGFAQMGLHLSQDPCCLHSDPQRMVIQQLSFVNVRFFLLFFSFFICLFSSLILSILPSKESFSVFMSWCNIREGHWHSVNKLYFLFF